MSVYLKQFSTHSEYDTYINGSGAILPNVSICTTEGDVHYNPFVETRVVAKYNVTSTSSPTQLCYDSAVSQFSVIEIDDVVQPSVVSTYTFSTTGEHIVKYTLTDPTIIGGNAFQLCSSLTSIDIPDSVTIIGNGAFQVCSSLTSCTIGSGVTSIGGEAFYACGGLTSIDIPSGVTGVGYNAFYRCSGLTNVTVNATTPPTLGTNVFKNNASGRKIYAPSGSVEAYKAATNWSEYANDIEPIS